jgi:hypothetical protein
MISQHISAFFANTNILFCGIFLSIPVVFPFRLDPAGMKKRAN